MKKNIIRAFLILCFIAANHVLDGGMFDLFLQVGPAGAQVAITSTTLASTVNGPAFYNGPAIRTDTTVFLASVSGISAPLLPGTPVSVIYVGREAMGVFSLNTSLNSVNVLRGYLGTQATPHPSGDMVLISNVYNTTQQYGANPVPSGFFQVDPPYGAACNPSATPTTPWVNVLTGAQWLCSSVTNTWVPGFQNPLVPSSQLPTATVASAAGSITPSGPLFAVSGTSAITGFTAPVGCNATAVGGCMFTIIPTGVFTWTAAGNISVASTALNGLGTYVVQVGLAIHFVWNAQTSKWDPIT